MPFYYFAHRERLRSIVMTMSLCLCVCLSARISGTTRAIFTKFLCLLPVSVAQCSSGMFTTGRITYRREGVFFPIENALSAGKGDGSACAGEACYLRLPGFLFMFEFAR